MAGENIDFKVRVLGVKQLVELNNQIQATSKQLSEKKKALKTDEKGQQENMKSVLQLTDTLKKQRKEFREGTKQQQKVQTETKKTTSFTMKMATAFGVAQLAVGGFQKVVGFLSSQMKDSINVFKEFDFQMQKVRAISGATDLEFKRLKESAEALGRTTFFTATQVAELQTNLSKLGFTATEILQAQDATLATATASGENLARTATVMGSAIRGFGLDASEATRVADVMATAFTSSALDIEKFQTSMTKVAPIAKMAGFEIEGTTALLASLTDAGIEASIAGTSLRNILLRLADPTSKLSKRLGGSVSSVDELLPRLKEMKDSGIALSDVLGITDKRTAAAFGRMLDSADNVAMLTEQLRNSEGAAAAMALVVGDSLQGAMLRFKSATDGLKIALVDLFGDKLQKGFDSLAKVFNNLASEQNIKRFAKFAKAIRFLALGILSYTIGAKSAAVATSLLAKRSLLAGASMSGSLAKGLTLARVGFAGLKTAIASTGIGLLIIILGELAASFLFAEKAIGSLERFQTKLNDAQKQGNQETKTAQELVKQALSNKEKMNKLLESEGGNLENNVVKQRKYNNLKSQQTQSLRSLNKISEKYNLGLLNEKSSIEDITKATDILIRTMKDSALQKAFITLSEGFLQTKVKADLIKDALSGEWINNTGKSLEDALKGTGFDMTLSPEDANTIKGSVDSQIKGTIEAVRKGLDDPSWWKIWVSENSRAKQLQNLLDSNGLTLAEFEEAIASGYYEDNVKKVQETLEKNLSSGASLFGNLLALDEDEPKIKGVTALIEEEAQRHSKALLDISNKSYKFESDRNILQLEEEIKHLETMKLLNMKMGEDGLKQDLKIQKKRDKILEETNKLKLDALKQEKIDRKLQIDEDFANELMTELQHKQALLDLEAWFLGQKGDLIAQDFQAYLENQNAQRQLDIDAIDLEKQAYQERINSVSELGSAMSELGNIMGENHILTKIGTKLSQAAAVAKNIEALKTVLNTKTTEIETQANLVNAGSEAAQGVASQSKQLFPMNLAAMAATLALVTSVLSMFGAGASGGSGSTKGEAVNVQGGNSYKFANGGLTNGGMFRGKSHANGGIKFASGGRIHEAEGGEAIINKRSTSMFKPVLSAINSYNGNGVKFADGGLLNSGERFAQGGQLADIQGMISQQQVTQQVIMVESDVTRSQGKVSAIESQATF